VFGSAQPFQQEAAMMTVPEPEPPTVEPVRVRPAFIAEGSTSGRDKARVTAAGEAEQIARILVAGYADTPDSRWLIADRDQRLIVFGVFWPAMVRYALQHGLVDVAVDSTGAVIGTGIWFDTANPGDPDGYRQALADTCRDHLGQFLRYDQLLARHQPDLGPDGEVAWLAVAAPHRGSGVGSALLRFRHSRNDSSGRPVVLTASSPGTPRPVHPARLPPAGRVFPAARWGVDVADVAQGPPVRHRAGRRSAAHPVATHGRS
jgi:GNAT superfamily N-acetyltransferase